jgi:protein-disulfide isomerase
MLTKNPNEEFTFSVDGNDYIINKKLDNTKKSNNKKSIHIPSLIIGVGITTICVIGVLLISNNSVYDELGLIEVQDLDTKPTTKSTGITEQTFFDNGSPILGNPNAPITLIEFGDYQCHFCNVYFQNTHHRLLENYVLAGDVKIIFKDFTIIGNDSINAAHAAHCAGEHNKYWEYHNILYNNWTGENNGWAAKPNLVSFANALNIDTQEFVQCMNSNRYNDTITQSKIDGELLGIRGTPAFFIINDNTGEVQSIFGAQPYETFEKVFDFILEN